MKKDLRVHIKKFLSDFARDERGQSTTEYILILSVVVMIAMKFKQSFSSKMGQMLEKLNGELDKGLQDTN